MASRPSSSRPRLSKLRSKSTSIQWNGIKFFWVRVGEAGTEKKRIYPGTLKRNQTQITWHQNQVSHPKFVHGMLYRIHDSPFPYFTPSNNSNPPRPRYKTDDRNGIFRTYLANCGSSSACCPNGSCCCRARCPCCSCCPPCCPRPSLGGNDE